jgi:toxin ParE1/3/4
MKATFSSRANREIHDIINYYLREASAEVAGDFLNTFRKTIERIKSWPLSYPLIDTKTRRAIISKFPFLVLYQIESPGHVRILAVRHQRQNPDLGVGR